MAPTGMFEPTRINTLNTVSTTFCSGVNFKIYHPYYSYDYTTTTTTVPETAKQRTDRLSLEKLKENIVIKFSEYIEDKKPIFNGRHQAYQKFYLSHLYH